MPKAKPRTVTGVSITRSAFNDSQSMQLFKLLKSFEKRGAKGELFSDEAAFGFVRSAGGAIVCVYDLYNAMTTGAERRAWFARVNHSLSALRVILLESNTQEGQLELRSEDPDHIDSELCRQLPLDRKRFKGSPLIGTIDLLTKICESKIEVIKDSKKISNANQELAGELAYFWHQNCGSMPTASVSDSSLGTISCSPFIDTLRLVLAAAEPDQQYHPDRLKSLATRGINSLKKRHAQAYKYLKSDLS